MLALVAAVLLVSHALQGMHQPVLNQVTAFSGGYRWKAKVAGVPWSPSSCRWPSQTTSPKRAPPAYQASM